MKNYAALTFLVPVALSALLATGCQAPPPRVYGELPEFVLSRQDNVEFGSKDLQGRVWIANFIFTRCGLTCPRQTRDLAELQREIADHQHRDAIHFVSVTVDPEHDTQIVLSEYAKAHTIDLKHWSFLTGDRKAIWTLCKEGFMLPVTEGSDTNPNALIDHSAKFVLVDRQNRIRGFYDSTDVEDWKQLKVDLESVLLE